MLPAKVEMGSSSSSCTFPLPAEIRGRTGTPIEVVDIECVLEGGNKFGIPVYSDHQTEGQGRFYVGPANGAKKWVFDLECKSD